MRKQFFFMLIFATAGLASVNAQMRIGGEETPNKSAVLDLNPDDNVSSGNATLGLALPRVHLKNVNDAFPLLSHVKGMTVYNMATTGGVKPGVYVNNGSTWLRQADSETVFSFVEKDGIVGNEITNATDGSLSRSGAGTAASPYTLAVASGGIESRHLKTGAVTAEKLADGSVSAVHIADNSITRNKIHNEVLNEIVVTALSQEKDGIVGNEVINATSGGGLVRSGAGTTASPFTLGIASGGVTTDKLADRSVTFGKLAESAVAELENTVINNISNDIFGDNIVNLIHANELDGIVGNEITNATDGSLARSGAGTAASPYTLAVSSGGIESRHLKTGAITTDKLTAGAVTSDKLAGQSVTMEKLSADVLNELQSGGSGMMQADAANSILLSDANKHWTTQQIPGAPVVLNYQWYVGQPAGWVDLGYSNYPLPRGLYSVTVSVNNGGTAASNASVDYAVLDAGNASKYTLPRKYAEARQAAAFEESGVIYIDQPNALMRLFIHTTSGTYAGSAALLLQPIIQLYN
jgi:hypothetical protein